MKNLVRPACLALGLLLLPLLNASADDKKEAPTTKSPLPQNWGKLGLSDEQKAKIYSIQGKFKAKIDDLKKQLAELQKEEKAAMSEVLTDAQKARLKELALEKVPGGSGTKPDDKPVDKKP